MEGRAVRPRGNGAGGHRRGSKGSPGRILWFFSRAFRYFKEGRLLEDAAHAYRFLRERFLDPEYDGVYWLVDCDGRAEDDFGIFLPTAMTLRRPGSRTGPFLSWGRKGLRRGFRL